MKASENEIFFVEDDVEPNTEEGQFNDIPTKLELRTNDLCTQSHKQELIKPIFKIDLILILISGPNTNRTLY